MQQCSSVLGGSLFDTRLSGLDGCSLNSRGSRYGRPPDILKTPWETEQKDWKIHSKRQLAMASPFKANIALIKADISPVVTAGTIKARVSSSIPKDTWLLAKNPSSPMPEVTLVHSMSFFPLFWKFSFKISKFLSLFDRRNFRSENFSLPSLSADRGWVNDLVLIQRTCSFITSKKNKSHERAEEGLSLSVFSLIPGSYGAIFQEMEIPFPRRRNISVLVE